MRPGGPPGFACGGCGSCAAGRTTVLVVIHIVVLADRFEFCQDLPVGW